MIRDVLFKERSNWMKTIAALLLGMAALVWLILQYGFSLVPAIADTSVLAALLVLGMLALENVFRFYVPKSSEWWLVFGLPLLTASLLAFVGEYLIGFFLDGDPAYVAMVASTYPIRVMFFFLVFIAWSAILVFYGKIEDQMKTKERQEKIGQMAKEAELFHLRQQLQPHFLFNSLNSVSALVKAQPEKARTMILQLSDFLRATIKRDDQKWLSVAEEKAYLDLYLQIEMVRFGHRLSVIFDMAEDCIDQKLPPLIVQPLLENAIKHGLYGLTGEVQIRLGFICAENNLLVKISNPFDPTTGAKPSGEGFGLESIKRRMYLLFGRADLLDIQVIQNEFQVTLKIPQNYVQSAHSG